jgi:large subunit ribosomal protein L13
MMTVDKTYVPKGQPVPEWVLIDANEQTLGRLATQIAHVILGKNKPTFTPGVGGGDAVVVVNAAHVRVTGKRLEEKFYYSHSGYPGGLKAVSLKEQLRTHPDRVIRHAVWGMIPHNKLGRQLINRIHVYGESEHPHAAQKPRKVL